MQWQLRLAEYRLPTEYKKGVKNCLGDAMSRMGSANHAVIYSEDDLPSNPTNSGIEHQMPEYDVTQCPSIVNDINYQPPDNWRDDEADRLNAILAVQNDLPEMAEPLLYEELHKQEADELCNYVRSLIEGGATSVYTEEQIRGYC